LPRLAIVDYNRTAAVLGRIADSRGLRVSITGDHTPEFEGEVVDAGKD
jgi:hypothetical protein